MRKAKYSKVSRSHSISSLFNSLFGATLCIVLRVYTSSEQPQSGKIFTSIEQLYEMLLRNLLSRIDKKSVKAKAMNTKQSKMLTNLQIMVEELNEYNEVKVESRRQAQQRLV